jgi:branched-chain amino acid aminotransferase group I
MEELVYLNGNLVPHDEAKLSPFDHGFLYGYGLFETMRAYNGCIFRLDRHLDRLYKSADILGIGHKLASLDLEKACYKILEANKLAYARLRLTVSAGEGDIVPDPATCDDITVFIVARNMTPASDKGHEHGVTAIISSRRRCSQSLLTRLKTTCYLENMLARQEAWISGADEALLLNEHGMLAEGSYTNIFLVNKQALLTPPLESGALPGITREAVLQLARSSGIEAVEKDINPEQLLQAEEAFLTNSVIEIVPLTWLDNKPIGAGKPGTLTRQFMAAYEKLVKDNYQATT